MALYHIKRHIQGRQKSILLNLKKNETRGHETVCFINRGSVMIRKYLNLEGFRRGSWHDTKSHNQGSYEGLLNQYKYKWLRNLRFGRLHWKNIGLQLWSRDSPVASEAKSYKFLSPFPPPSLPLTAPFLPRSSSPSTCLLRSPFHVECDLRLLYH